MASAAAKPEKRLGEFLKEQQEPFTLEVYLLERGYSAKWSSNGYSGKSVKRSASVGLSKKRKALLSFSKVLTALHKKLAFHNERSTTIKGSDDKSEHVNVTLSHEAGSSDHTVVEIDRFSTASSSTVFHSCSDIDEDGTSLSSQKDKPLFPSDNCQASSVRLQSQQTTNNGKHRQRCIEDETIMNRDVTEKEQRIRNCGVLVPKKITEDSLLSAALWSLLIQSAKTESYTTELRELIGPNVSQMLKSKRVLHKTKQVLFGCVREITITLPRKDDGQQRYKRFMGPEELGKILCERTKEWGQQTGDETNLSYLLTLDYLNSNNEWSKFEQHVKDISVEIADTILERVNDEIVSDMIEILPPTV